MDEDEDVILEGSALHAHLLDHGFSEIETVKSQNGQQQIMMNNLPSNVVEKNYHHYGKILWNKVLYCLGLCKLNEDSFKVCAIKLLEKKLLFEQDILSVDTIFPDLLETESQELNSEKFSQKYSLKSCILTVSPLLLTICLLSAILIHRILFTANDLYVQLVQVSLIICLIFFLRWILVRKHHTTHESIEGFCRIISKVNKVCMKAQKTLIEMSLIEKSLSSDYHFVYREAVKSAYEDVIEQLITYTTKAHCELSNLDYGHKKAIKPLFEARYDPVLIQSEELSLKEKRYHSSYQLSGLLTEFLMSLNHPGTSKFHWSSYVLFDSSNFDGIDSSCDFLFHLLNLAENAWKAPVKTRSYKCAQTDILKAAEALSLHVKTTVARTSSLMSKLEEMQTYLDRKVQPTEPPDPQNLLPALSQICQEIKCDIQSSLGCAEEVEDRITSKLSLARIRSEPSVTVASPAPPVKPKEIDPPEPVEDEVFELFIDKNENSVTDETEDIELSNEMKRRERSQCARVFKEIQPILQKRRNVWEKREQIALEKKKVSQTLDISIESPPNVTEDKATALAESSDEFDDSKKSYEHKNKCINEIESDTKETKEQQDEKYHLQSQRIREVHIKSESDNEEASLQRPNQSYSGSDYDSEEESLIRYRKVKADLDEDEASRSDEKSTMFLNLPDIKTKKFVTRPDDEFGHGEFGLKAAIGLPWKLQNIHDDVSSGSDYPVSKLPQNIHKWVGVMGTESVIGDSSDES